jgi:hypothetical protein
MHVYIKSYILLENTDLIDPHGEVTPFIRCVDIFIHIHMCLEMFSNIIITSISILLAFMKRQRNDPNCTIDVYIQI